MVLISASAQARNRSAAPQKLSLGLGDAHGDSSHNPCTPLQVPSYDTSFALRPVKPCPGVPGIHLNADLTVSMTAALLCGAGASPVHKDRGCSADHDQIEDHAHAQRHA